MKLYQKRKDKFLAIGFLIFASVCLPFVAFAFWVEHTIKGLWEIVTDIPGEYRAEYKTRMEHARYRRACRQAARNNPKLNWD